MSLVGDKPAEEIRFKKKNTRGERTILEKRALSPSQAAVASTSSVLLLFEHRIECSTSASPRTDNKIVDERADLQHRN